MSSDIQKLHLGCFDIVVPGWINTDVTPHIYLSRIPGLAFVLFNIGLLPKHRYLQYQRGVFRQIHYLNVAKRFPFADDTFDYVYSSHLIEHLYHDQAAFCLRETHRVLKKGGVIRVSTPDLDALVRNYTSEHADLFIESIFEARQQREKNRHHWCYNQLTLTQILNSSGFCDVYRCQFQQGRCVDLELLENRPGSLFMEAIKPG